MVKYNIQKYSSIFYMMLFIFQIALKDSSTIKNFSIDYIHALYSDDKDVHHDDLTDFERTDEGETDEGESDEKNDKEENEEQDLEDDLSKQVLLSSNSSITSRTHFVYIFKPYSKTVKEHFPPPDCKV